MKKEKKFTDSLAVFFLSFFFGFIVEVVIMETVFNLSYLWTYRKKLDLRCLWNK